MESSILSEVFKGLSFSEKEKNLLVPLFKVIDLKKGTKLLKANETVAHQYFVSSGSLRTYFIDNSAKEHTLQFAVHDWWISDYIAYFTNTKSTMNIECLQDARVYQIGRNNIEKVYIKIPKIETFFRKKMEKAFSSFQKRILSNLSQSAKEKYLSFMQTYPNIEQNVKNYHIASYLGITTESLSRIRREITHY